MKSPMRRALEKLHDLFSEMVEDGRVRWADKNERRRALAAFNRSNRALGDRR